MKATCRNCGDQFKLTQEQIDLLSDGFIERPETCDDCLDMEPGMEFPETRSDADPGL